MDIFKKIKTGQQISDSEFMTCGEEPIDIFRAYENVIKNKKQTIFSTQNQYEKVVEQNRSLQGELSYAKQKIKELSNSLTLPLHMVNTGEKDYGEFVLLKNAWFACQQFPKTLGVIEIKWKQCEMRKTYLGIVEGNDFDKDVLYIAQHGHKIFEVEDAKEE